MGCCIINDSINLSHQFFSGQFCTA